MEPYIIGAAVSGLGAIFGGKKASDSAKEQVKLQNQATAAQYNYDMQAWELQHDKIIADREFAVAQIEAQARNEGKIAAWKDAQNLQRYNYDMMIRNREQESLNAQYMRSDEIYTKQITLNALTAKAGREDEYRRLQEVQAEASFNAQQLYIDQMQAEGQSRVLGAGRSGRKRAQVTYADLGRNIAQIQESLGAAGRNTRAVLEEISRDHASADLAAYASKMLDPGVLPEPIVPFKTPMADFMYPRQLDEFDFGPQPLRGAFAQPSTAANQVWGTTISSVSGTVGGYISKYLAANQ